MTTSDGYGSHTSTAHLLLFWLVVSGSAGSTGFSVSTMLFCWPHTFVHRTRLARQNRKTDPLLLSYSFSMLRTGSWPSSHSLTSWASLRTWRAHRYGQRLQRYFSMSRSDSKENDCRSQSTNDAVVKLLFTSRIILNLILCFVKASAIALIRIIFAINYKSIPLWFRSVMIASVCDILFGSLLTSAGCSSSSLLEAPYHIHDSTCPHNVGSSAFDHYF